MPKLAIITTHPIQYYAPVFKLLSQRNRINIKVFYTWGEQAMQKHDPGFAKEIIWDIPLLDGYDYEFLKNTSTQPGSHHFTGIINPDIVESIAQWKPEAILVFGWAYNSHLRVMRHFKKKLPVYFRGDSTLLDEHRGIRQIFKSLFLKWVYSHVDHAFYVGTNTKAYFKKYGLRERKLSFSPHAIDNERFKTGRESEALVLRTKMGIGDNDVLILFAGKLEEKKSPGSLIDAVIKLNNPHVHLLVAGDGQLKNALHAKAAGYKNIHFLGFQNQSYMPVVYQACDLFCLPSTGPNETWGLAVNEAMACGKAVVVSDKCGCAIDLVTEKNGLIFKTEKAGALFLSLNTLTLQRAALAAYGAESRNVIKNWNFLHIATSIEDKLLNER